MNAEPEKEHRWLDRLVGEWTYEGECTMGPGQPAVKNTGVEVVRSLGGLWTIGEGEGDTPNGGTAKTVMTLATTRRLSRFLVDQIVPPADLLKR